ncbi:hypothetical protein L6R52_23005 [Myxococcota bacterium]|nr:hypothetical protein [Myxococcota bacterium]
MKTDHLSLARVIRAPHTAATLALALTACGGAFGEPTPRAEGQRLVTGALTPPDASTFSRRPVALELAAARLDARGEDPVLAFVAGPAIDPSSNGGRPVAFRVALPTDASFVLFFQVPVEGPGRVGQLVAPIRFTRDASGVLTDLLGGRSGGSETPLADVDLGVVDITVATGPGSAKVCDEAEGCTFTHQVIAGEGGSVNPLAINDTDGDGTPDLDDDDDDDDLIPDRADDDANGDALPDAAQTLDALTDGDADGTPDRFEASSELGG